jgi:LDH2 family malate/lactate/ureidoglycolate dehydrogenase
VPHVRVDAVELESFASALLEAAGVPAESAVAVAAQLVGAELTGHGSHGLRLLGDYCDRCRSGWIDPAATARVEHDDGSTVRLDGRRALGQVAGRAAMELAIQRARAHGVAVVTLRRSGHLGRLADYVEQAAAAGVIAILAANDSGANEVVAPHGAVEPRLATNPIAVGIPRRSAPHLVLDMSTSVASHGTIHRLELEGAQVPESWTSGGMLLPLGGAKGTGLALVVEVLAGMLSGAGFSDGEPEDDDYQGAWMAAIDPERFLPPGTLTTDVERLVAHVRSARPRDTGVEVLVPGEHGERCRQRALLDGVRLPSPLWDELAARARQHGVPVPDPARGAVAE